MSSPYLDPAVAATYDRLAVPAQFDPPARDLVAMLDVPDGGTALDVGTGTGAVGRQLAESVGPSGLAVGVDASIAMLHAGRRHARYSLVASRVPGLPFRDDVFDVVTAAFVLTHVERYDQALVDMVRVCTPRGRVGLTAWGSKPNPVAKLWRDVVATVASTEELDEAFRRVIPWDGLFADPANIERTLREARLTAVTVVQRDYVVRVPAADFLAMKASTVEGTLLRRMLDAEVWDGFTRAVARAFREAFGDIVEYVRDVCFGIGAKNGRA